MKKIAIYIPLFFLSCKGSSPLERVYTIDVINMASFSIYSGLSYRYPDTSVDINELRSINGKDSVTYESKKAWEEKIESIPGKKLIIFIFNRDTVEKYGWEKVKADYRIEKRFELTAEYLSSTDKVVFDK